MLLFFLTLFLFAPAFVARIFQRARWKTIAIAFACWFGGLVLMGLLSGNPAEGLGWAVILGMFLSVVMVPLLIQGMRQFGLAEPRPPRIRQSPSFGKSWRQPPYTRP